MLLCAPGAVCESRPSFPLLQSDNQLHFPKRNADSAGDEGSCKTGVVKHHNALLEIGGLPRRCSIGLLRLPQVVAPYSILRSIG